MQCQTGAPLWRASFFYWDGDKGAGAPVEDSSPSPSNLHKVKALWYHSALRFRTAKETSLEDELIGQRRAKMEQWAEAFPGASPDRFETTASLAQVCEAYRDASAEDLLASPVRVRVAGRLMALRKMGKLTFAHVAAGGARLQLLFERGAGRGGLRQARPPGPGGLDRRRGDPRAHQDRRADGAGVASYLPLRKCLRPLPEKWHGLADVEQRYRQRHLDLIMNPESVERFRARSRMTSAVREFMAAQRLRGGGDPHAPPHRGRRRRAALRDAPQRAGHASSSCASRPSSTSSASWWAACPASSRSTATSGTRASTPSTTPSSP